MDRSESTLTTATIIYNEENEKEDKMTNNIGNCGENANSSAVITNEQDVCCDEKSIQTAGSRIDNFDGAKSTMPKNHYNNLMVPFHDNVDDDIKSPYEPTINIDLGSTMPYPDQEPLSEANAMFFPNGNDNSSSSSYTVSHQLSTLSSSSSTSFWKILHKIIVVIASATINGVVFGVVNNFGVFYAHLTELSKTDAISSLGFFNKNANNLMESVNNDKLITNSYNNIDANHTTSGAVVQSLIAGVGSLNVGLIFFCSIFASVLSDRYGIRSICFIGGSLATIGMYASSLSLNLIYLYITYGVVLGIGASLVYGPSLAILGHYFTKRLGLVNGIVTAGSSAFSIVMPIILRWMLDQVGIQATFKYLTILVSTLIICSLSFKEQIIRPAKQNSSAKTNLANMFFYDTLWKNNLYLYWVISIPLGLFGYFVPFCHLVKHAREIDSIYQGEVLIMSIGITSMIGRLITGPLADFSNVNRIILQQLAFASIGFLTICLPFVRNFALLLICCGLGFFDGTFISLLGPIAFDLVGPEYANQAIGLLLCFCSIPLTIGPPIAAYAYGIYGNYKLAFCLAGIPPIFASVVMFNIIRLQRIQRRRTSTVTLGIDIDGSRCLSCNKRLTSSTAEKLHLLINNSTNDNLHHYHHHTGINGTTKLKLSNNDNEDNSGGTETTDLLQTNDNAQRDNANMIVILSNDHRRSSLINQSRKSSMRI